MKASIVLEKILGILIFLLILFPLLLILRTHIAVFVVPKGYPTNMFLYMYYTDRAPRGYIFPPSDTITLSLRGRGFRLVILFLREELPLKLPNGSIITFKVYMKVRGKYDPSKMYILIGLITNFTISSPLPEIMTLKLPKYLGFAYVVEGRENIVGGTEGTLDTHHGIDYVSEVVGILKGMETYNISPPNYTFELLYRNGGDIFTLLEEHSIRAIYFRLDSFEEDSEIFVEFKILDIYYKA